MKRYQKFLLLLISSVSLWIIAMKQYPSSSFLPFLPLIVILLFGLYSATVILYGVLTFNDCKKEYFELKRDIEEAESFLLKNGIQFSPSYQPISKKMK
jgi:Na+/H+-dicarboxylate symporter